MPLAGIWFVFRRPNNKKRNGHDGSDAFENDWSSYESRGNNIMREKRSSCSSTEKKKEASSDSL